MARTEPRNSPPAGAGLLALALLLAPVSAQADPTHASLESAREAGYRITALGEIHGLAGYLLRAADGGETTIYITPGGAALVGELFGPDGLSLTAPQVRTALPRADATRGQHPTSRKTSVPATPALPAPTVPSSPTTAAPAIPAGTMDPRWATSAQRPADIPDTSRFSLSRLFVSPAAAHAGGEVETVFLAGDPGGDATRAGSTFELVPGTPVLTVWADPRCAPSRDWLHILAREARGKFGVAVAPVGVLGADSATAAVAILGSASPRDAWLAWHDGVAPTWPVDSDLGAARVLHNNTAWESLRIPSVPVSTWLRAGRTEAIVGGSTAGALRWHWARVQAEIGH